MEIDGLLIERRDGVQWLHRAPEPPAGHETDDSGDLVFAPDPDADGDQDQQGGGTDAQGS